MPRDIKMSRRALWVFETFSRLSRLGPGRLFSDFFWVSGARRARETPVNGQRVPKRRGGGGGILSFQKLLTLTPCDIESSALLFQPQTVTPHKQRTPNEHLARGRLWVDSWSSFGQFRSKMTKTDQKPTENRLHSDLLQDPDRCLPLRRGQGLWLK